MTFTATLFGRRTEPPCWNEPSILLVGPQWLLKSAIRSNVMSGSPWGWIPADDLHAYISIRIARRPIEYDLGEEVSILPSTLHSVSMVAVSSLSTQSPIIPIPNA